MNLFNKIGAKFFGPTQNKVESENFELNGFSIILKRRSRQRSLRINVHQDGRIVATANKSVPIRVIRDFILSRWTWLEDAHQKALEHQKKFPVYQFVSGEKFLFLGEERTLEFRGHARSSYRAQIEGDRLVVLTPNDSIANSQKVRQAVTQFYKINGEKYLRPRLEHWRQQMGLQPKKVSFRGAKTSWGSCSRSGAISLNWKLLFAPPEVIDYVVIHELSHMVHFNHSSKFWGLVAKYSPNYKEAKRWLHEFESRMATFDL